MSTPTAASTLSRTLRHHLFRQHHPSRALTTSTQRLAAQPSDAPVFKAPEPIGPPPLQSSTASTQSKLIASLRSTSALRSTTEPYVAYGATEDLFKICASTCNYTVESHPAPKNDKGEDVGQGTGWWFEPKAAGGLELPVTFNIWAQVMYLHMYIFTTRLRAFPKQHIRIWEQNLLDHFFYAAEERMAIYHGMAAKGVRNKYLKELWVQWRGILLSYDEGLVKGDAVLAAAVWRNIWQASEEANIADISAVVAYMRQEIARMGEVSDEQVTSASVAFGSPMEAVKPLADMRSPWMGRTFTQEDLAPLKEELKA